MMGSSVKMFAILRQEIQIQHGTARTTSTVFLYVNQIRFGE